MDTDPDHPSLIGPGQRRLEFGRPGWRDQDRVEITGRLPSARCSRPHGCVERSITVSIAAGPEHAAAHIVRRLLPDYLASLALLLDAQEAFYKRAQARVGLVHELAELIPGSWTVRDDSIESSEVFWRGSLVSVRISADAGRVDLTLARVPIGDLITLLSAHYAA